MNHYKIGCNHIFMWTRQHIPDKNKVIQGAYAKECVVKSFNLYISRKGKYKIWRKKKNPTISWLFQPTMIEFTTYITFFFSFFFLFLFFLDKGNFIVSNFCRITISVLHRRLWRVVAWPYKLNRFLVWRHCGSWCYWKLQTSTLARL